MYQIAFTNAPRIESARAATLDYEPSAATDRTYEPHQTIIAVVASHGRYPLPGLVEHRAAGLWMKASVKTLWTIECSEISLDYRLVEEWNFIPEPVYRQNFLYAAFRRTFLESQDTYDSSHNRAPAARNDSTPLSEYL